MTPTVPLRSNRRRRALAGVLGALGLVGLLGAGSPAAGAAPSAASSACPGFRVLHNDRIGAASFPAGTYAITVPAAALSCKEAGELFSRFLEDYDGVLPRPWSVSAEGSGKASFQRGGKPGFSVARGPSEGEGNSNPYIGKLCPGTFTVNATSAVGTLRFTKGKFLVYLPARTAIGCNTASILFTRFLAAGGPLPSPWRLENQTATFYKPAHPTRSSFRIEPLDGSGVR